MKVTCSTILLTKSQINEALSLGSRQFYFNIYLFIWQKIAYNYTNNQV